MKIRVGCAHSILAAELHYWKVSGRQVAGRSDTRNETATQVGYVILARCVQDGKTLCWLLTHSLP